MERLPAGRLKTLKDQIAIGEYRVDSSAVAEEMIRKMNLIRAVRREMGHPADRILPFQAPRRPG